MRRSRKVRRVRGYTNLWYYVDANKITLCDGGSAFELTRKQLERAIEIMDEYKRS